MARVKHIAIRTHHVEETAAFYEAAFDLTRVGTGKSGVYLTDGYLNIAILEFRPAVEGESMKLGVDHIGFHVDDVDATVARIKGRGGRSLATSAAAQIQVSNEGRSYFEVKCLGPDEQVIDVSSAGWVGATESVGTERA